MLLFSTAFRPFFLGAGILAVIAVPVWLGALHGGYDVAGYFGPNYWHAHEMLFGFSVAVIAGFLLTAARQWTGRPTLQGPGLGVAFALWLLGRVGCALGQSLGWWALALDFMFLPYLAVGVGRPLLATKNRRNYVFLALLGVLALSNLGLHLDALGAWPGVRPRAAAVALDAVLLVILLVGGRIIPLFTRNATRQPQIRNSLFLDRLTLWGGGALLLADALVWARVGSSLALLVGLASLLRARHWGTRYTLKDPLLWSLHLGYLWIPTGLLLRAAASLWPIFNATWLHALTVGGVGLTTLAMMARVALGHSGRKLIAPRLIAWAFGILWVATLVRVVSPFLPRYVMLVSVAGSLWTLAFALYLVVYVPILLAPRVDGRPG